MEQLLGNPLPFDDHAVSVSLPLWSHVVGYEEGDPVIVNAMKTGYPRFKLHSSVSLLSDELIQKRVGSMKYKGTKEDEILKWSCFLFPTSHVANRFKIFLIKAICLSTAATSESSAEDSVSMEAVGFRDVHVVYFPAEYYSQGKAFWQHTGEVLSSRHAEDALTHLGIDLPALTLSTTTTTASVQIDNTTTNGSSHSAIEVDSDSISDSDSDSKRQRLTRVCASESHVTQYRHDNKHSSQSVNSNISLTSNSTATSVNSGSTGVHDDDILGAQASQTIRNRIASLLQIPEYTNQSPSHGGITLTLCGMASISTALRLVQAHFQQILQQSAEVGEMVVFGFPYLDTLKLVQRKELSPGGYHFFGHGNESDLDKLEALLIQQQQLQQQEHHQIDLSENHNGHNMNKSTLTTANATTNTYKKIWAVFTEFPSNPLLRCPNLIRLSSLAKTYGFLIIVDDTIGSFCNVDLMNHSDLHIDILCTSLTKIFSGVGDAFAGSLVVNPRSICASQLRTLVTELLLPDLYYSDAITLEYNSRDYPQRAHKINCTAERLVSWLSTHPCTECVHYPTLHKNSTLIFDSIRRTEEKLCDELKAVSFESGYGCLFSIILREEFNTQAFFDALDVCKGPSLGTNFTLACPYTLLAHYTELPWAAEYGVSSRLVRVSVGLEEYEILQNAFDKAFVAAGYKVDS